MNMTPKDVLERSPLRVFERAIGGGLGAGNIGLVLSRHGVGKTSFLVGLALDHMLHGRDVLHISTKETVEGLRGFYEELFNALAEQLELDHRAARQLEMERHRHILVYNRDCFTLEKLEHSVEFLRQAAGFAPDMVIMDGTPRFEHTEEWEMQGVQRLARDWQAEIWTSAHTHREGQETDARGVPAEVARFDEYLGVIVALESQADHVRVRIVKDHGEADVADVHLEFDPRTRLLRWR
jgi:KaiC/GvpD/RAD55 family RecA-like ATPase